MRKLFRRSPLPSIFWSSGSPVKLAKTRAAARPGGSVVECGFQRRGIASLRDVLTIRQRFVLKHMEFCRKVGLFLGHTGYIVGLFEYGVTDMVLLRFFAMAGAGLVVGWQLMQPKVQMVTAFWNAVYSGINLYQLMRLQEPELSWEETRLHDLLGGAQPARLSVRQLRALMALGEWHWLVDGAKLLEKDHGVLIADGALSYLYFITVGVCEVSLAGQPIALLGPGSAVGEASLLLEPSPVGGNGVAGRAVRTTSVAACGSVRCFVAPVDKVRQLVESDAGIRGALDGIFADTLAAQLAALNVGAKVRNYRAVLEVACPLDDQDGVATGVFEYRRRHGIPDDVHAALLEELPQCVHKPFRTPPPAPAKSVATPGGKISSGNAAAAAALTKDTYY